MQEIARSGIEVEALRSRPQVDGPLQWWLSAFHALSRSRQFTMGGAAPIPYSEICAYLEIHGIDDVNDRVDFCRRLTELDSQFLEHQNKDAKP